MSPVRTLFLALVATLATLPTLGQVAPLARTMTALRALKQADDFDFPEPASGLLVTLRDQLKGVLEAGLAEAPASETPAALEARLQAGLGGAPGADDAEGLGGIPRVKVHRPKEHPGLLLVTAEYGTFCGRTTSLFVFRKEGGSRRLAWALEPGDSPKEDPGQEGLAWGFSDSQPDGSFCLATSHNPPWCTSCWSRLDISIVRFDADGTYLGTVLETHPSFYRCDDSELPHIAWTGGGFTVRYRDSSSDPELWDRKVVLRYAPAGEGVRAEPAAGLLPDETLDLWKDLKPEDAARWSEASAWAALRPVHGKLHGASSGTFRFAQREKGKGNRTLVAYQADPAEGKKGPGQVWYFILSLRGGIYRVAAASTLRPPGFPGASPVRPKGGISPEA